MAGSGPSIGSEAAWAGAVRAEAYRRRGAARKRATCLRFDCLGTNPPAAIPPSSLPLSLSVSLSLRGDLREMALRSFFRNLSHSLSAGDPVEVGGGGGRDSSSLGSRSSGGR